MTVRYDPLPHFSLPGGGHFAFGIFSVTKVRTVFLEDEPIFLHRGVNAGEDLGARPKMNSAEDLCEALLVVPLPTREKLIGKILLSLVNYRVASRAEQDEVVERATLSTGSERHEALLALGRNPVDYDTQMVAALGNFRLSRGPTELRTIDVRDL